jgi:hypothetical protein
MLRTSFPLVGRREARATSQGGAGAGETVARWAEMPEPHRRPSGELTNRGGISGSERRTTREDHRPAGRSGRSRPGDGKNSAGTKVPLQLGRLRPRSRSAPLLEDQAAERLADSPQRKSAPTPQDGTAGTQGRPEALGAPRGRAGASSAQEVEVVVGRSRGVVRRPREIRWPAKVCLVSLM